MFEEMKKKTPSNRFHVLNMLEKFPRLKYFTTGAQGV